MGHVVALVFRLTHSEDNVCLKLLCLVRSYTRAELSRTRWTFQGWNPRTNRYRSCFYISTIWCWNVGWGSFTWGRVSVSLIGSSRFRNRIFCRVVQGIHSYGVLRTYCILIRALTSTSDLFGLGHVVWGRASLRQETVAYADIYRPTSRRNYWDNLEWSNINQFASRASELSSILSSNFKDVTCHSLMDEWFTEFI